MKGKEKVVKYEYEVVEGNLKIVPALPEKVEFLYFFVVGDPRKEKGLRISCNSEVGAKVKCVHSPTESLILDIPNRYLKYLGSKGSLVPTDIKERIFKIVVP